MAVTVSQEFEKATFHKVAFRLIPFLFLCYIVAFLDHYCPVKTRIESVG